MSLLVMSQLQLHNVLKLWTKVVHAQKNYFIGTIFIFILLNWHACTMYKGFYPSHGKGSSTLLVKKE